MSGLLDAISTWILRQPPVLQIASGLARRISPIHVLRRDVTVLGADEAREVLARAGDFEFGPIGARKMRPSRLRPVIALVITAAFLIAPMAGATSIATLFANADTSTVADMPDLAFGSEPALAVDVGIPARTLVGFDLSGIPAGARLLQAELHLSPSAGTEVVARACSLDGPFSESTTTWNNQPGPAICTDSRRAEAIAQLAAWDVRRAVQSLLDGPLPPTGFGLFPDLGGGDLAICGCADQTVTYGCAPTCQDSAAIAALCDQLCVDGGGSPGQQCSAQSLACSGGVGFPSREANAPPSLFLEWATCGDGQLEAPEQCEPPFSQGGSPTCSEICSLLDSPLQVALNELEQASLVPVEAQVIGGVLSDLDAEVLTRSGVAADPVARAFDFVERFRALFGLVDPPAQLYVLRVEKDELDADHVIFGQRLGPLPVFGAELAVHLLGDLVLSASGNTQTQLPAVQTPAISQAVAVALALGSVPGTNVLHVGAPRLGVFVDSAYAEPGSSPPRLAWRVKVAGIGDGEDGGTQWRVMIDAQTGSVLLVLDDIRTADRPGEDIRVRSANGGNSYDCSIGTLPGTVDWFDEDGVNGYPGLGSDLFGDGNRIGQFPSGLAHGLWHYNLDELGWSGWNGDSAQLDGIVHVGTAWQNASFSPSCGHLRFGDGFVFTDITGHEFRHGVADATAGLVYRDQSGAIDESLADLFGALLEFELEGGAGDWLIGEDSPGGPVRSMSDPPSIPFKSWAEDDCPGRVRPDHMDAFFEPDDPCLDAFRDRDNNGVHINSSILNKAFFLMTAGGTHRGVPVTGLGTERVGRLMHRVERQRLRSKATFANLRNETVSEARLLRRVPATGFDAGAVCQVVNAFAAVGLGGADVDCDGTPDVPPADADGDGIADSIDYCPAIDDPANADSDGDGIGDACDPDDDDDLISDDGDGSGIIGDGPCTGGVRWSCDDNCRVTPNADQADDDGDGIGEVCDDDDGDGVPNASDNCEDDPNPEQLDTDMDGQGDACDPDSDDDGVLDDGDASGTVGDGRCASGATTGCDDNCPINANPLQEDPDGDGVGTVCDLCPADPDPTNRDLDADGLGDVCDDDIDGDGVDNATDTCDEDYDPFNFDLDGNGIGLVCDPAESGLLAGEFRLDLLGTLPFLDPAAAVRVPIRPCLADGCPDYMGASFRTQVRVSLPAGLGARLLDEEARVVSLASPADGELRMRFRPRGDFFFRPPAAAAAAAAGAAPLGAAAEPFEARRYFLEIFAESANPPLGQLPITLEVTSFETDRLCGDADDDGDFDGDDAQLVRQMLADAATLPQLGFGKCSVIGGPSDCDLLDSVVMRRDLATPSLAPRVADVCTAATQ